MATGQSLLVLVVDDEGYFREIFSTKLIAEGFRVETAEDGRQAIEKAKQLKPDLILMDVRMPVVNGVEAVMELRDDPVTKDLKIVFLTQLGESHEERQAIDEKFAKEMGVAGYLRKSDNLEEVVRKIKTYLQ